MPNDTHTPTPKQWATNESNQGTLITDPYGQKFQLIRVIDGLGGWDTSPKKAAEKLVRAVNSHDALMAALEETTNQLHLLCKDEHDDPSVGIVGWNGLNQLCHDNRALLARAKGTP